jgi:tetratricopeptide (TPR) repeat protein
VKDFLEEAWIVERLAELDEPTKPQEALQRYRDAAEIYGRVGDVTQESSSLAFMARLYSRLKEPALAAEAAGKSLELARKAGSPKFIGGALDELGKAYRDMGRKKEAEDAFRESIQWTEGQRLEILGGEANGASFLTDGRASPYSSLMDLRAEQGDVLEAVQLSEQVRGRRLLDAMAQGMAARATSLLRAEKVFYKKRQSAHIGQVSRLCVEVSSSVTGERVAGFGVFVNHDPLIACEGFFYFGGDLRTCKLVLTSIVEQGGAR